jgi:hypothetical protein
MHVGNTLLFHVKCDVAGIYTKEQTHISPGVSVVRLYQS